MNAGRFSFFLLTPMLMLATTVAPTRAQVFEASTAPTRHPALFLVGDSITKTGTPPGDTGPWGMG
jgi:hypothetical protein